MKIIIPGGTGQVGTLLARAFHGDGHEVVVLSRRQHVAPWRVDLWDGRTQGAWSDQLNGADVVINLAGQSVNCRYTPSNRMRIFASRMFSTYAVGTAITHCAVPPAVWLQASTATIYAHRYDAPNTECHHMMGGTEPHLPDTWRFSVAVAHAWEQMVDRFILPTTRSIKLRSAITMSPDPGSAFDVLLGLVRHGLGGQQGNGRQFVSWIHDQDFVQAMYWLIDHPDLAGAINLSAPHPLPNAAFMRILRLAWGTHIGLPAMEWMLDIGARVLHTETELVLKSRRVIPTRLVESGFQFVFPTWHTAAQDLCHRWRAR